MRENEAITVTLGDLQDRAEARVRSGAYRSVSDVVRAGLQALDREEAEQDAVLARKIQDALNDPRPAIPAEDVFAALRSHHAERTKAAERDT